MRRAIPRLPSASDDRFVVDVIRESAGIAWTDEDAEADTERPSGPPVQRDHEQASYRDLEEDDFPSSWVGEPWPR